MRKSYDFEIINETGTFARTLILTTGTVDWILDIQVLQGTVDIQNGPSINAAANRTKIRGKDKLELSNGGTGKTRAAYQLTVLF